MRIAVLDKHGWLIGVRNVEKPKKDDVPCGDLPANGSYRWDAKRLAFIPKGFGHDKPQRPGVDRDRAVYLLIKALLDGTPIPEECRNWCAWYERYHG